MGLRPSRRSADLFPSSYGSVSHYVQHGRIWRTKHTYILAFTGVLGGLGQSTVCYLGGIKILLVLYPLISSCVVRSFNLCELTLTVYYTAYIFLVYR